MDFSRWSSPSSDTAKRSTRLPSRQQPRIASKNMSAICVRPKTSTTASHSSSAQHIISVLPKTFEAFTSTSISAKSSALSMTKRESNTTTSRPQTPNSNSQTVAGPITPMTMAGRTTTAANMMSKYATELRSRYSTDEYYNHNSLPSENKPSPIPPSKKTESNIQLMSSGRPKTSFNTSANPSDVRRMSEMATSIASKAVEMKMSQITSGASRNTQIQKMLNHKFGSAMIDTSSARPKTSAPFTTRSNNVWKSDHKTTTSKKKKGKKSTKAKQEKDNVVKERPDKENVLDGYKPSEEIQEEAKTLENLDYEVLLTFSMYDWDIKLKRLKSMWALKRKETSGDDLSDVKDFFEFHGMNNAIMYLVLENDTNWRNIGSIYEGHAVSGLDNVINDLITTEQYGKVRRRFWGKTFAFRALNRQWLSYNVNLLRGRRVTEQNILDFETHLERYPFLGGHCRTMSDTLMYFTLYPYFKQCDNSQKERHYNLSRWFRLMQTDERLVGPNQIIQISHTSTFHPDYPYWGQPADDFEVPLRKKKN